MAEDRKLLRIRSYSELNESEICCWKDSEGSWLLYIPRCGVGSLRGHKVFENADGTITVKPSIRMTGHDNGQPTVMHGTISNSLWHDEP